MSRVAKVHNFYGKKPNQGAAEGSMRRAATKVHNSSNNFIKWVALHTIIVKVSLYLVIVNTLLYKLY